jgi:hypothetical protein
VHLVQRVVGGWIAPVDELFRESVEMEAARAAAARMCVRVGVRCDARRPVICAMRLNRTQVKRRGGMVGVKAPAQRTYQYMLWRVSTLCIIAVVLVVRRVLS